MPTCDVTQSFWRRAEDSATFKVLAQSETEAILQRDAEDAEKLAAGIAKAVAKGVLEANPPVEATFKVDVLGKSADAVAEGIIDRLGKAPASGCILVLTGLSGTGKGTTVSKLQASLPNAASWSNGNVFRALTLLAVTHCEQSNLEFKGEVLTPDLLQKFISCLEFSKFNGRFDIRICGLGYDLLVSEVANTVLKEPRVSKNIPTVAEMTQGEVVCFAAKAAELMRADGMNVLMEGRSQTLDYIRTPHRFELTLPEPIIIGMRRAAQRMMGSALQAIRSASPSQRKRADIKESLNLALAQMLVSSIPQESFGYSSPLTATTLQNGDDSASNAIISSFSSDSHFLVFSQKETEAILQRDAEDAEKLAAGIAKAVAKGVLEANPPVEATFKVDVLGKSADAVAEGIIDRLGKAPASGCILVLTGLSGTGKGTTVSKLQASLPNAASWSNGNVFRALTLLAVTHCEQSNLEFKGEVLTPDLLQKFISCLEFSKFNGRFDIRICGLGYDLLVSEVANTVLKEPRVSKNIPTVAEMTQGEVVCFAAKAAELMRADGMNVLMEGRSQTLDYIRTPHRFELTLPEPIIIGMRRAAQRMMGSALEGLKRNPQTDAYHALRDALFRMLYPSEGIWPSFAHTREAGKKCNASAHPSGVRNRWVPDLSTGMKSQLVGDQPPTSRTWLIPLL